ncbi:hypothetical protein RUM43_006827 [Polyplax serrata]|uniref:Uncharacterized protein n=1 Tax=Polyplax serrata TaxID=468196 RepID=A0AAN8P4P3_POLSC
MSSFSDALQPEGIQGIGKNSSTKKNVASPKRIEFPREVRIIGRFSHVDINGTTRFSAASRGSDSVADARRKQKNQYVIIPVEAKNSTVHFVKVPLLKLCNHPKSTKVGRTRCKRIISSNETPAMENLFMWLTDKDEFQNWRSPSFACNSNCRKEETTCFIFRQSRRATISSQNQIYNMDDSSDQESQHLNSEIEEPLQQKEPSVEEIASTAPRTAQVGTQIDINLSDSDKRPNVVSESSRKFKNKRRADSLSVNSRVLSFLATVPNKNKQR